jgi:hypothetical protein
MDRLLAAAGGTLDLANYDALGDLTDAGGGNGTAAITDSAAVAVAGSPFTANHVSTGLYRVTLPTSLSTLDVYDVLWTMPDASLRSTRFELVGTFLFTIASLQAFDAELANETTYPPARVRDIRETVEDRFAQCARVSFTRRGMRDYLDGDSTCVLFTSWPQVRRVVSVKVDGVAQDVTNVKSYNTGRLELVSGVFPWGRRNIEVLYEHGYDPVPSPAAEAGKIYARELIVKGAFDDMARATSVQTELGLMRISQAAQGRVGVPEVDAVLADWGYAGALVG